MLRHIKNHYDIFKAIVTSLLVFVTKFMDYNYYVGKYQAKPVLKEAKLRTYVNELSNFLAQPLMSKCPSLQNNINSFVEATQKTENHLNQCNTMTQEKKKSVSKFNSDNVVIDIQKGGTGTQYFYKN